MNPSTSEAKTMAMSIRVFFLACALAATLLPSPTEAPPPPPVKGLQYGFYQHTCPQFDQLVRMFLCSASRSDVGLLAGLLRMHFHDCFVQGCDGSVLLDGSASGPSEQEAIPNLTLRQSAFKAVDALRALIDQECGAGLVSCADILAVAARDSVFLSSGPDYDVPLGRRDSKNFATTSVTAASLPPPFDKVTALLSFFTNRSLTITDLVTLSGGHTIGLAHCTSFTSRLYPTQDPIMDKSFAGKLKLTCPASNTTNTTNNDIRSPNTFDNKYYVDLMNRQGLFTSDQDLYTDSRTKSTVLQFALNQSAFFEQFVTSVVKMGQLGVLTGSQGEIRTNCSARNTGTSKGLWPVVMDEGFGDAASAAF